MQKACSKEKLLHGETDIGSAATSEQPLWREMCIYWREAKRKWQHEAQTELPRQVSDDLASAFREFCSVLVDIADEAGRREVVSPEHVERAEDAKLRLENARTLFELYLCRETGHSTRPLRQRPH